MDMPIAFINLTPGTYYQDILTDGTRSVIRSKFPKLMRVSYDTKPAVVRTLKIVVEDIDAEKTDQDIMQKRFNRPSLRTDLDMLRSTQSTIEIPAIMKIRDRVPELKNREALIKSYACFEHGQNPCLLGCTRMETAREEAERLFK